MNYLGQKSISPESQEVSTQSIREMLSGFSFCILEVCLALGALELHDEIDPEDNDKRRFRFLSKFFKLQRLKRAKY